MQADVQTQQRASLLNDSKDIARQGNDSCKVFSFCKKLQENSKKKSDAIEKELTDWVWDMYWQGLFVSGSLIREKGKRLLHEFNSREPPVNEMSSNLTKG